MEDDFAEGAQPLESVIPSPCSREILWTSRQGRMAKLRKRNFTKMEPVNDPNGLG